jgi:hypothetical protein
MSIYILFQIHKYLFIFDCRDVGLSDDYLLRGTKGHDGEIIASVYSYSLGMFVCLYIWMYVFMCIYVYIHICICMDLCACKYERDQGSWRRNHRFSVLIFTRYGKCMFLCLYICRRFEMFVYLYVFMSIHT